MIPYVSAERLAKSINCDYFGSAMVDLVEKICKAEANKQKSIKITPVVIICRIIDGERFDKFIELLKERLSSNSVHFNYSFIQNQNVIKRAIETTDRDIDMTSHLYAPKIICTHI
jgi:hypothetical protein